VLYDNGFLYDSSIDEVFPSDTSPDFAHRLWPFSMDYGIPQVTPAAPLWHCLAACGHGVLCGDILQCTMATTALRCAASVALSTHNHTHATKKRDFYTRA
jgi:hypothetical protein